MVIPDGSGGPTVVRRPTPAVHGAAARRGGECENGVVQVGRIDSVPGLRERVPDASRSCAIENIVETRGRNCQRG